MEIAVPRKQSTGLFDFGFVAVALALILVVGVGALAFFTGAGPAALIVSTALTALVALVLPLVVVCH